jgi:hypothetical protein
MKTIKNIILNLKNGENQEFDIFNNKLKMNWIISFEFSNNKICMMTNYSTLNAEYFNSLNELENYLEGTFLTDENFQLH